MGSDQIFLLVLLAITFILLLTERLTIDLTAVLLIITLGATQLLTPEEALSGFGSEPAIVAAAVFVLSGALYYTGLSDCLGSLIGRLAGKKESRMVAVIMLAVAALSAFTHHLTMTAVMLPVTLKLSRDHNVAASKLLMPMSFAASLGTTITILGAPAFLIAHRLLQQAGQPGLNVFSIAPFGLTLTLLGTVFILLTSRFLLPERNGQDNAAREDRFQLDSFYTELVIADESSLAGLTISELEEKLETRFQVAGWLRQERPQPRPFGKKQLKAKDVLLVRTTPDELATVQHEPGLNLRPVAKYKSTAGSSSSGNGAGEQLVQAVIAPRSELAGRTIGRVNFLEKYRLLVVGIWRRSAWLRAELANVRLREGDVLLLLGEKEAFNRLQQDRSFLMLVPFAGEPFMRHRASLAALIMIGSIALAALNVLATHIALLMGAATVVLFRCLTPSQAYRSIDIRIYVFIAGAIPLGLAMEQTGTADLLAGWMSSGLIAWPLYLILLVLFFGAAVLTQIMSDAGTVALLGPIAIALARTLNHAPEAYAVVVAIASVASFLTPIGHHGNLLVYGPGGYQFSDFLRVGAPLTIIVALITTFLALLLWSG